MPAPPIVVYTHRVPAVGPALLRDACDVREAPGDATPSADEIVHRAHDADALCFFVPDRIDDALRAFPVCAFSRASVKATTTSISRLLARAASS